MKFTILNLITFLAICVIFSLVIAHIRDVIVLKVILGLVTGVAAMLSIWVVKLIKNQRVR